MRGIPFSFCHFARISLFIFCSRKDVYSLVSTPDLKKIAAAYIPYPVYRSFQILKALS